MAEDEIVQATTRLLDAVARADYEAYAALSDSALTCVEPETMGHVVQGEALSACSSATGRLPRKLCSLSSARRRRP